MKSSDMNKKMMARIEVLYFPLPLVTWFVHTRSSMQNDPKGLSLSLSLPARATIRSTCLDSKHCKVGLCKFIIRNRCQLESSMEYEMDDRRSLNDDQMSL